MARTKAQKAKRLLLAESNARFLKMQGNAKYIKDLRKLQIQDELDYIKTARKSNPWEALQNLSLRDKRSIMSSEKGQAFTTIITDTSRTVDVPLKFARVFHSRAHERKVLAKKRLARIKIICKILDIKSRDVPHYFFLEFPKDALILGLVAESGTLKMTVKLEKLIHKY